MIAVSEALCFRFIACVALPRTLYLLVTKTVSKGGAELAGFPSRHLLPHTILRSR
jgi:hypothetical protein